MKMNTRLAEIFTDLIKIDGVSGNERAVADYAISFLKNLGLRPIEDGAAQYSGGNAGNVICPLGSGGNYTLIAHMDTARPTKDIKPQFGDDRITSDGTTILGGDNRAGMAIILYNVEKALQNGHSLNDFTIVFTICEETSSIGSEKLKLADEIKMGFILDSSLRPGNFIYRSYGSKRFTVDVWGKAAHSGLEPEKGISAIWAISRGIAQLKLGRVDEETTMNVGLIEGGSAINVIPEKASLLGEVRSMNVETVQHIIDRTETIFQQAAREAGAEVDFRSSWDFVPYEITADMEVYQKLTGVLTKLGLNPVKQISAGGSDANSLNGNGIPAINIGIGAQKPHSNEEFILYEDFDNAAKIGWELMHI